MKSTTSLIYLFLVTSSMTIASPPQSEFTFYMYPMMRNGQIYGYRPKTNESYFPERIDGDVVVRKDDGIYGVFLFQEASTVNRIVLGDLDETLSDAAAFPDFTISFLFKFIYPLPQGEAIRVVMTNPQRELRPNSNPVDIHFFQIAENVSLHAEVGQHDNVTDGARVNHISTMDHWTHATVVYHEPAVDLETEIYLNGSRVPADLYENPLIPELPGAQPYEYTIGHDQQSAKLSLSWFQLFKGALSAGQVKNLSDDTISRALRANQVEVKFTITSLRVEEEVKTADLLAMRSGNTEIASIVSFSASDGTAKLDKDFNFASTDDLVFKPGEVYLSINVPILSDDYTEEDENFTISMISKDNGVTTVTQGIVTLTIANNTGPAGPEGDAQSGQDDECAVDATTSCLIPLILLCVAIGLVALGIIILLLFLLTLSSR